MSESLWRQHYEGKSLTVPKKLIEDQAILLSEITKDTILARVSEFDFSLNNIYESFATIAKSMSILGGSKRNELGELTNNIFT